jgi:electron transfer flavoprotein alpha subunit
VILVHVDHDRGEIDPLSLQALALARTLGSTVEAALAAGDETGVADACAILAEHGADVVHVALHPGLSDYAPQATARALTHLASAGSPTAVLAAGSARGNEVMAHLGAILDLPLATDCTEITMDAAGTRVVRARWGGNLLEEATVHSPVLLATTLPHAFLAAGFGCAGTVRAWSPELPDADLVVRVVDRVGGDTADRVGLAEAAVIVSGGRGVGGPEGFAPLEELADLLGGTVGCSRVVTSAGWRPHAEQVGQTGTKVAPELYLACGISGATQHLAGCKNSKVLVAINTDAQAPIMQVADYVIVDDLHSVLPEVIKAIGR